MPSPPRRAHTSLAAPLVLALLGAPLLAQGAHVAPGNTGLTSAGLSGFADCVLRCTAYESPLTGDLNGDGDLDDWAPHLVDAASHATLALPFGALADARYVDERFVAMLVNEGMQQQDLNGDGDVNPTENVVHLHDLRTGVTENLGLALRVSYYRVTDELVVMCVDEAKQGAQDLNGDGDTSDAVLHVRNLATGHTVNTGVAAANLQTVHVGPRSVAFVVPEGAQGGQDLDGDGDADDNVIHVYDSHTGLAVNTGVAELVGGGGWGLAGERLVVHAAEQQLGVDANGDGDLADDVVSLLDLATGVVHATDITWGPLLDPRVVLIADDAAYLAVPETDTTSAPCVLHRIDGATGATTSLDMPVGTYNDLGFPRFHGSRAAWRIRETTDDLNGDGDLDDRVVHVLDTRPLALRNLGLAADEVHLAGDTLVALVPEAGQGGVDRNGDGDLGDRTPTVVDLATGRRTDVPYAAFKATIDERLAVFLVREAEQGQADINGDGDTQDAVFHVYDRRSGEVTVLGPSQGIGQPVIVDDPAVAYLVWEADASVDLNGDGDKQDNVIHVVAF